METPLVLSSMGRRDTKCGWDSIPVNLKENSVHNVKYGIMSLLLKYVSICLNAHSDTSSNLAIINSITVNMNRRLNIEFINKIGSYSFGRHIIRVAHLYLIKIYNNYACGR